MKRYETIFVRRKVNGAWRVVEIRIERKRRAAIFDRLVRKHKLTVIAK
jgi:hypothetical protein